MRPNPLLGNRRGWQGRPIPAHEKFKGHFVLDGFKFKVSQLDTFINAPQPCLISRATAKQASRFLSVRGKNVKLQQTLRQDFKCTFGHISYKTVSLPLTVPVSPSNSNWVRHIQGPKCSRTYCDTHLEPNTDPQGFGS